MARHQDYSDENAQQIDNEIKRIVTERYDLAKKILKDNIKFLHALAEALLEYETLNGEQIDRILKGEKLPPLPKGPSATQPVAKTVIPPLTEESEDGILTARPTPFKA